MKDRRGEAVTISNIGGTAVSSRVALALAARANGPVLSVNYTAHLNPKFRTKTGPAAIGVASGDSLRLRAAAVRPDASYHGTRLTDFIAGDAFSSVEDIDGLIALSEPMTLTLQR